MNGSHATADADLVALLAAILLHPAEDTPRLMMADWLQENDQPERAEFIRVQCELARLVPIRDADRSDAEMYFRVRALENRERELFEANRREWFKIDGLSAPGFGEDEPLGWWPAGDSRGTSQVMQGTPRRGFVESVTCRAADWLAHGDAIRTAQPVTAVTFTTPPESREDRAIFSHREHWLEGRTNRWLARGHLKGDPSRTWGIRSGERYAVALALYRAEWPGVAFELPRALDESLNRGEGLLPAARPAANLELEAAMAAAGLEEAAPVTPEQFREMMERILRDALSPD